MLGWDGILKNRTVFFSPNFCVVQEMLSSEYQIRLWENFSHALNLKENSHLSRRPSNFNRALSMLDHCWGQLGTNL
jgi:hypothetical protein